VDVNICLTLPFGDGNEKLETSVRKHAAIRMKEGRFRANIIVDFFSKRSTG
jgi:hypothetical protein